MADEEGTKGKGSGVTEATIKLEGDSLKIVEQKLSIAEQMAAMSDADLQRKQAHLASATNALLVEGEMLARMGQKSQAAEVYERAREAHLEAIAWRTDSISAAEESRIKIQALINEGKVDEAVEAQKLLDIEIEKIALIEDEIALSEERLKSLEDYTEEYRNLSDEGKKFTRTGKPALKAWVRQCLALFKHKILWLVALLCGSINSATLPMEWME